MEEKRKGNLLVIEVLNAEGVEDENAGVGAELLRDGFKTPKIQIIRTLLLKVL
jgi:hypothetical protein